MTEYNDDGTTYDAWMKAADAYVASVAGVGIHDLADGPSADAWLDCVPPEEYAIGLLVEEGFPFPELG